jgi:predicted permease
MTPRLPRWIVSTLAPQSERRYILNDLHEDFVVIAQKNGLRAARRWYWRQTLASAGPLARLRFQAAIRTLRRFDLSPSGAAADAWQGARWLARHPTLSTTVVVTLTVAFAAALAGFCVIDSVLLRPLPFPDPDRIVLIEATSPQRPAGARSVSLQDVEDWQRLTRTFDAVSACTEDTFRLTGRGEPREIDALRVAPDFQRVLAIQPAAGRAFGPLDFTTAGARAVILTHGFWQREFGGDPSAIGRALLLNEESYRIVGVLPRLDVTFPEPHDIWVPLVVRAGAFWEASRGTGWVFALGRVKDSTTVDVAQGELTSVMRQLAIEYPRTNKDRTLAELTPVVEELLSPITPVLFLLALALSAVLIVALGNLATLLLATVARRRPEFAVRMALGAGAGRIARQIGAECVFLSSTAAAVGLLATPLLVTAFMAVYPAPLPRRVDGSMSLPLLGTALLLTFTAVVLLWLPQALAARTAHRGMSVASTRTTTPLEHATRFSLIAAQVALSLMVVVAAASLVRTMQRLNAIDPGFDAEGVLAFMVTPSPQRFTTAASAHAFYNSALEAVRSVPGVQTAAAGVGVPLMSGGWRFGIRPPGAPRDTLVSVNLVSPGYFETLGIKLLAGRQLTEAEQRSGAAVALVNGSLARILARDAQSVVGTRMNYSGQAWEIVGVADDVRHAGPRRPAAPEFFIPWHMAGKRPQTIVVRASGDSMRVLPAVAARIHEIDPTAPLSRVSRMRDRMRESVAADRFRAMLVGVLALVALILASIGAYSVTAVSVARRTREFGIRMALGEERAGIWRRAVWTALSPACAGVVAGAVGASAAARLLESFVFEVSPRDPLTLAAVALGLLALATTAAAISARRAAHVDPLIALRTE